MIRGDMIKHILQSIYKHPEKKNIFGYLIEISAFKGVFGTTKELIDSEFAFQRYLKTTLGKQFVAFEQIIKFLRNVLSHSTTSHIQLKTDDFIKQKDYLKKNVDTLIDFKFLYADAFPQWKGSKDYGIHIQLDFKKMKDGQSLFDLISLHQLYLLTELCFNLSEIFRINTFPKKSTSPAQRKK
ncbi:hypothetical protein KKG31_02865 [Patescibacteria group bacterium]|nr:hypothetical protein [Patescibacteria group bacterium]MBU1758103.1 hypothetical protein [Patescibacteria group bacterium]